jgi:hypothetical protein
MAYAAQDIIKASLRILGVIDKGESPSAAEMQEALQALNMLIDSWSADSLTSIAMTQESFQLWPGVSEYTIGPYLGTLPAPNFWWNTTKPIDVNSAFYRDSGNNDYQVDWIDKLEYDGYVDKITATGPPQYFTYDQGETQQLNQVGYIYIYPVPDLSTYSLFIESIKPFTSFTNLTDVFTFPPYYERAFKYNLAIELAPEYGLPIQPAIAKIAEDSFKIVERNNVSTPPMQLDLPRTKGGIFNILSGSYGPTNMNT